MRNLIFTLIAFFMCCASGLNAKDKDKTINWNNVDFVNDYKIKAKIPGTVGKSLASNPTFINDYTIAQASLMKGSSHAGTLQKQGVASVFSEVELEGISPQAIQKVVDELYLEFVSELKNIGLNITEGDDLLNSEQAQSKKEDKNSIVGKAGKEPVFDDMRMTGLDIREQYVFRPAEKNVYTTWKKIPANFYQKVSTQQNTNMISIGYTVRFASFDGDQVGLSKNRLTTSAAISITPSVLIVNTKGAFSWVTFGEAIWGNNGWSEELVETKSRNGSYFGLSSKGEYAISANEEQYLAELKSIVSNLQKSIASLLKESI
jgi:hypothetical protein